LFNLLAYLLTDTECAFLGSMVWCKPWYKRGLLRRKSNFGEIFVHFKGYGAKKNLLRNFRIKVGDCGH